MRFLISLLCLTLLSPATWARELPDTYFSPAFGGRVVDVESGQPIEGAVVVASWMIERAENLNLVGMTHTRVIHVVEAVTDAGGFYRIPETGPLARPAGWEINSVSDPGFMVFKPGYEPEDRPNIKGVCCGSVNERDASLRKVWYDGKDIPLYKYGKKPKVPTGVYDPSSTSTPERDIQESVKSFVRFIDSNVDDSDDVVRGDSPKRLAAARAQIHAILITDEELRRLYGSEHWNKTSPHWTTAIDDVLKEARPTKPPAPLIRQAPPPHMYGPPPGYVAPNTQRNGQ